jgi:RimJ/RimL family protein N-acetyltransferase
MFKVELKNNNVRLIKPNPLRDSPLAVGWLADPHGRITLEMMGVVDEHNNSTTLEIEESRIHDFLNKNNQYNWMISLDGKVVGTIWVELEEANNTKAPSLDFMIGDPSARGKGLGRASVELVLNFLKLEGFSTIHARYLTKNGVSSSLLSTFGFIKDSRVYVDENGLEWQNVKKDLS